MEAKPSPLDIIAEVSAVARRSGMTRRITMDIAALAIIRADQTVSLGEARRIVANHLPQGAA